MRWQVKTGKKQVLQSKTQDFHLIRPVCALGTFPSRGRLEKAFPFLAVWFFDSLRLPLAKGSCHARGVTERFSPASLNGSGTLPFGKEEQGSIV